jgi:hypothetical protein
MIKFGIIFGFVFLVMVTIVSLILGNFGAMVLFTIGIAWTVRLVIAVIVSGLIAGSLS